MRTQSRVASVHVSEIRGFDEYALAPFVLNRYRICCVPRTRARAPKRFSTHIFYFRRVRMASNLFL